MANKAKGSRVMQRHGSLQKIDYSPSTYIQNLLLHEDAVPDNLHKMFCEMDVLGGEGDEQEWKEYARWVKYEEDVEEGGGRWSKPHVASLNMQALFELRNTFSNGCILLDVEAADMTTLIDIICDRLVLEGRILRSERGQLQTILSRRHHHQHDRRSAMNASVKRWHDARIKLRAIRTFSEISKSQQTDDGSTTPPRVESSTSMNWGMLKNVPSSNSLQSSASQTSLTKYHNKYNTQFLRKIPKGAEVANIMIGELENWNRKLMVYVRLKEGTVLENVSEVELPTKFIFILIGPPGEQSQYCEMGRAMAAMTVDEVFREVAYKGTKIQDFLAGIDEFMDHVTVLPPGEWDPSIRLEPPSHVPPQITRRISSVPSISSEHREQLEKVQSLAKLSRAAGEDPNGQDGDDGSEGGDHTDPALERTGRFCGGLIADVKRKMPWYISDYTDALHIQCFASFIFLYLATLTPNVTFGAVLAGKTNNLMGAMECILAAAITGVAFALFSGQPLNILGSTGPMLVLETIIYNFCTNPQFNLDYMPYRFWIGMWTALILLLVVAFDLSALVKYITRFTEETFATLIAAIFIYEAIKSLVELGYKKKEHLPFRTDLNAATENCTCRFPARTLPSGNSTTNNVTEATIVGGVTLNISTLTDMFPNGVFNNTTGAGNVTIIKTFTERDCHLLGGTVHCEDLFIADAFMFSIILFCSTLFLCLVLGTWLRNTDFFTTFIRNTISDFGVLIAIVLMVIIDYFTPINTRKLEVPDTFKPTSDARPWVVSPLSDKNPWWLILTGIVPALLAAILIFMDQQITAVIVNRKENKLKKGSGYHLDLLIVALLVVVCSVLGLPWYVAATVSAVAHVISLKRVSETAAPGEKPMYLGAREQRVTALLVGILSGVTIFLTPVLKLIPLAVLFGVFMYMGIIALMGMQLITRIIIIFKPPKYQPDLPYLRHVRLLRVYLFTFIQVVCFAILWVVKHFKDSSIVFPIMVLLVCFVRFILDYVFSQDELKYLDQKLPPFRKPKAVKDEDPKKDVENGEVNKAYDKDTAKDTDNHELKVRDSKPIKFYVSEDAEDHDHLHADNYYNHYNLPNHNHHHNHHHHHHIPHHDCPVVPEETPKDIPPDVTYGTENTDLSNDREDAPERESTKL